MAQVPPGRAGEGVRGGAWEVSGTVSPETSGVHS